MTVAGIPVTVEFPGGKGITLDELDSVLDAYLVDDEVEATPVTGTVTMDGLEAEGRDAARRWYLGGIEAQLRDLAACASMPEGARDEYGRGWEKICADVAHKVQRYGLALGLESSDLREKYLQAAPRGGDVTDTWLAHKWNAQGRLAAQKGAWPLPDDFGTRESYASAMFGDAPQVVHEAATAAAPSKPSVNVTNLAVAYEWALREIGTGPLSDLFRRGSDLVLVSDDIETVNVRTLRALIQQRYDVHKETVVGDEVKQTRAMFPKDAADILSVNARRMPNLRELKGVTRTPMVRPDGTVLDRPGFDGATGYIYAPDGAAVFPVPERPLPENVTQAKAIIDYMLTDFAFVSPESRANYIGLMLTPLLRLLAPPPYKLGSIEAHQPGSGKSFLGRALISLHGGSESASIPVNDEEFAKVIGSVFDTERGGAYMFDNVTGGVRSPVLTSLLTQPRFTGRRLGSSSLITAVNDRLWVLTANNAQLGGDLARRVVRVMIDPGVPNPEKRTGFVIDDWERWVRGKRNDILWSLLVLVRHWYASGTPQVKRSTDSYARWTAITDGVLRTAGYAPFDSEAVSVEVDDPDEDELATLLGAVLAAHGSESWQVRDLTDRTIASGKEAPGFIDIDAFPQHTTEFGNVNRKKLGWWLKRNQGRWARGMCLIRGGDTAGSARWKIKTREQVA